MSPIPRFLFLFYPSQWPIAELKNYSCALFSVCLRFAEQEDNVYRSGQQQNPTPPRVLYRFSHFGKTTLYCFSVFVFISLMLIPDRRVHSFLGHPVRNFVFCAWDYVIGYDVFTVLRFWNERVPCYSACTMDYGACADI